jgi:hypothetical protein
LPLQWERRGCAWRSKWSVTAIPENVFASKVVSIPDWFGEAIMNDQSNQKQANTK